MNGTASMAEGDLSVQVSVHSDDETGLMALAFNAMMDSLRGLVFEVGVAMTRVKGIANQLNRGTHEQDGASAELTRCVEQMSDLGLEVKNFAQEQRRDSSLIPCSVEVVADRIK